MNLSFLLFVIGIVLISYGYVNQISPKCNDRLVTKYVQGHVYDDIIESSVNMGDDYRVFKDAKIDTIV